MFVAVVGYFFYSGSRVIIMVADDYSVSVTSSFVRVLMRVIDVQYDR